MSSGTDKIVSSIMSEAQEKADVIIQDANANVSEITAKAEKTAEAPERTAQRHLPEKDPCDHLLRGLGRGRQGRQHPPRGLSAGSPRRGCASDRLS